MKNCHVYIMTANEGFNSEKYNNACKVLIGVKMNMLKFSKSSLESSNAILICLGKILSESQFIKFTSIG